MDKASGIKVPAVGIGVPIGLPRRPDDHTATDVARTYIPRRMECCGSHLQHDLTVPK